MSDMDGPIKGGSLWRDHEGRVYRVVTTAVLRESDNEPLVIYGLDGSYWRR